MKKKNQIEILRSISVIHRNQFDKRRDYEWRVIFATLGIFTASAAAKLTGQVTLSTYICFRIIVWIVFFILTFIASIYLYFIHQANKINRGFAEVAENLLMHLSGNGDDFLREREKFMHVFWDWSLTWQVLTLFLFSIVCSFLITS